MRLIPKYFFWVDLRYNLSKGADFMKGAGWTIWSSILVVGPIGFAVMWRKKRQPQDSLQRKVKP